MRLWYPAKNFAPISYVQCAQSLLEGALSKVYIQHYTSIFNAESVEKRVVRIMSKLAIRSHATLAECGFRLCNVSILWRFARWRSPPPNPCPKTTSHISGFCVSGNARRFDLLYRKVCVNVCVCKFQPDNMSDSKLASPIPKAVECWVMCTTYVSVCVCAMCEHQPYSHRGMVSKVVTTISLDLVHSKLELYLQCGNFNRKSLAFINETDAFWCAKLQ